MIRSLHRNTWITALLLLLFATPLFSQSYTVNTVPDPKTSSQNAFVSDPDNFLNSSEKGTINSVCQNIKSNSNAEVAVVILGSIGSEDVEEFATDLFTKWGLGSGTNDNGLLILMTMDQRIVTFRTGYGTETILPDSKTYQIQQEQMIPHFKNNDYGKGLVAGVQAVERVFNGEEIEYTTDEPTTSTDINHIYEESTYNYSITPWWYDVLLIYLMIMALPLLLFGILLLAAKLSADLFKKHNTMKLFTLWIWPILFPIPFIFIRILTKKLMNNWRNTVRISPKTGMPMHKMSEEEEDRYLEAGQITEERLRSIDYDVWVGEDDEDRIILAYTRWFSSYSKCPKCKYKTWEKEYDRTIVSPTTYSTGRGEKKHSCGHCHHAQITSYTIPRIPKRTSSSGSSGGGSWGGGGGGGGSWGGGSTGGGGSSSSW